MGENDRVLKHTIALELVTNNPPDWIMLENVALATLSDGTKALRITLYNLVERKMRGSSLSFYATNAGLTRCIAGTTPINATIELRRANDETQALATNLQFGDIERVPFEMKYGACGELDLNMELGKLPSIEPNGELYLNYKFGEVPLSLIHI